MALDEATNPVRGVSGPGKFAKRTDLQVQSTGYGDAVAYDANKSGAPLATAPKSPLLSQAPRVTAGAPISGMYDPTNRPEEPVTAGIDQGAGPGSEALITQQPDDTNFRTKIAEYMPVLNYIAGLPNTSPETRSAIRQLKDNA